jgi:aerotolerance regulator-like protein
VTFLAPVFLAAGAAAAGVIVLLHFLARRRPRPAVLPTARFVPDRPARWPSRAPRPTDWLLLALRVLAIIAIATAFAQPIHEANRAVTTRLVLVDRSVGVADERVMRDSALALLREGDVLIAFDTLAHVISTSARDSAAVLTRSAAPSSLSAALVAAERAAATARNHADSIELAIISPFASESWDDATRSLRARWPARVRLVSVPLARSDTALRAVDVRAPASDPVHAAAVPFAAPGEPRTRIVRAALSTGDSVWASEAGHVLVHWPSAADSAPSTAEAVVAPGVVLAAPLVRRSVGEVRRARTVARFADGAPAIVEHAHGDGCIRDVGFDLPVAGDVPLRESTRRLIAVVGAPCENRAAQSAIGVARMDSLRGAGPLLATSVLPRPSQERSRATSWLLIAGALLLMGEVGVRQRTRAA